MNQKQKLNKLVAEYESPESQRQRHADVQLRLRTLVDAYGMESTSIATGLAVSSISQYIRVKPPVAISEVRVSRAEAIFSKL